MVVDTEIYNCMLHRAVQERQDVCIKVSAREAAQSNTALPEKQYLIKEL